MVLLFCVALVVEFVVVEAVSDSQLLASHMVVLCSIAST